jgi:glucosamine-6-phosphate deaminase
LKSFKVNRTWVGIYEDKRQLGEAAARDAASLIREAIGRTGSARIIVGTGNSQNEVIEWLTRQPDIDWAAVEVFHMDEYVGIAETHPASFRRWLRTHLVDHVLPGTVHYVRGDATDIDEECRRYGELLSERGIDLTFFGVGENGHIAFNEPGTADFNDPALMKRITLDERSRRQQVGEGHFPSVEEVPREALTITCPVIARSASLIGAVPDLRKAEAVRRAIEGGLSTDCPASMAFTHPCARVYLDTESASLLG